MDKMGIIIQEASQDLQYLKSPSPMLLGMTHECLEFHEQLLAKHY